jgi:hypothetical protein
MSPGEDFEKISLHLIWQHAGRPPLRGKHPEMDAVLQGAWRYTSEKPTKKKKEGKGRPHLA